MCLLYPSLFYVCEHYICMYLSSLYYMFNIVNWSLLICTNKEFMSMNISDEQVAIVNSLMILLSVKSGSHGMNGFNFNEVSDLIHHISTM